MLSRQTGSELEMRLPQKHDPRTSATRDLMTTSLEHNVLSMHLSKPLFSFSLANLHVFCSLAVLFVLFTYRFIWPTFKNLVRTV